MKITKDLYISLFENQFSAHLNHIAKEPIDLKEFFLRIDEFTNISQPDKHIFTFELTFQSNVSVELFLRNLSKYTRERIESYKQNNRFAFYLDVENANIDLLKKDLVFALNRHIDYIEFLSVESGYTYLHSDKILANPTFGLHDN